jgi:hypothetical protein
MIVLDIEMPKSCGECPMLCGLYEYDDKGYAKFSDTKRHPDCPLKEILKPHGRLIDADKLADDLEWDAERIREELEQLDPLTAEYVQKRLERDIKSNAAWWIRNDADKNCLVPAEE